MRYQLSVCAVFRDEADFLDEWLTFHCQVGVEHFFLFDDGSTDNCEAVLSPWIEAGLVEVKKSKSRPQAALYQSALRRVGLKTKWLAFIDIDEFLWSPSSSVLDVLNSQRRGVAGLVVRWLVFGSSGVERMKGTSVIEEFTQRQEIDAPELQSAEKARRSTPRREMANGSILNGKTIVNPRRILRQGIHWPWNFFGALVNENGNRLRRAERTVFDSRIEYFQETSVSHIRINHYWSKSLNHLKFKVQRKVTGSFKVAKNLHGSAILRNSVSWDESWLNKVQDVEIQRVWSEAKRNRSRFLSQRHE